MSETSLKGWKMSAIHATGHWVHFGWQSTANFPDCGLSVESDKMVTTGDGATLRAFVGGVNFAFLGLF